MFKRDFKDWQEWLEVTSADLFIYQEESHILAYFLVNKGQDLTNVIHELAVSQYQAILLWAEAVTKAGSLERDAMLGALESGISIEGPSGTVTLDPTTHHAALDIQLMEVRDQKLNIISTSKQRPPSDTARYCNLSTDPDANIQYEVDI